MQFFKYLVVLGSLLLLVSGFWVRETRQNSSHPVEDGHGDMVWVPGGSFWMGAQDQSMRDALPIHRVTLDGFWMDKTEVTNEQFERFVKDTGYVTVAERKPNPNDFPGAPSDKIVPGSLVFSPPEKTGFSKNYSSWWKYVPGASWRHPEGPGSELAGREKHPVTHIAWQDAMAYAEWAGKRLPTEAEFEYASRGGLDRNVYSWGNSFTPGGKWYTNIWQGSFPHQNTLEDGFYTTAPVGSFPANGYGLYDMTGNVWEWCLDWYKSDHYHERVAAHKAIINPKGPSLSFDPLEREVPKKVQRGGSFLCNKSYCIRYLVGLEEKVNRIAARCTRALGA